MAKNYLEQCKFSKISMSSLWMVYDTKLWLKKKQKKETFICHLFDITQNKSFLHLMFIAALCGLGRKFLVLKVTVWVKVKMIPHNAISKKKKTGHIPKATKQSLDEVCILCSWSWINYGTLWRRIKYIYIYENVHCSVAKTQVGLNHHVRALPYLTHNMSAARVTKKLQHHQFLLQHLPHGMTNQ